MGIAFSRITFFDMAYKQNAFYDRFVTFGSPNMNGPDEFVPLADCQL